MANVFLTAEPAIAKSLAGATLTPYLYVADSGNNRIQVFDRTVQHNYLFSIGPTIVGLIGNLSSPYGVCNDGEYLWITDSGNNRIVQTDLLGNFIATWGTIGALIGELDNPLGVAVDDRYVWVVDSNNNRFQVFAKSDGTWIFMLGTYGSGDFEFDHPTDCFVDDVYFWIYDAGNARWLYFEKDNGTIGITIECPMPTTQIVGFTINVGGMNESMPMSSMDMVGLITNIGNISIESPMPTTEIWGFGGLITIDVPMSTMSILGYTPNIGVIDIIQVMPSTDILSNGPIVGEIDISVPISSLDLQGNIQLIGVIDIVPNMPLMQAQGVLKNSGVISLTSWPPTLESLSTLLLSGVIQVTAPMDSINGIGIIESILAVTTLVLNTENFALSEYNNYAYNSMTYFGGKWIGCNDAGLDELEGDKDGSTNIVALVRFPTIDLHKEYVKRLLHAWLSGRTTGELDIKVIENETEPLVTHYTSHNAGGIIDRERIKFSKAHKGRFVTMEIGNKAGCKFDLTTLRVFTHDVPKRIR